MLSDLMSKVQMVNLQIKQNLPPKVDFHLFHSQQTLRVLMSTPM
jgi:hypothetical protein